MWLRQFANGFPIVGDLAGPRVCSLAQGDYPQLTPQQPRVKAAGKLRARIARSIGPREQRSWRKALDRVETGWVEGPLPFPDEGRFLTSNGPQPVNPAFRLERYATSKEA